MQVQRFQAGRSKSVLLVWVIAAVVLGAATLGLVHHASVRRVRDRAAAEPLRPVVVIELARKKAASDSPSDSEPWRSAAKELGRELETFTGASLADIPAKRFAAWVLADPGELSDADFTALDSYLQLGGGAVLIGGASHKGDGKTSLVKLFPGKRFSEVPARAAALRVTGRSPLVAGLEAGEELALDGDGRGLAASSGDSLLWGDGASAALHGRYRGAPVAWLGVSPARVGDSLHAHVLADNALRFALREPVLDLGAWPDGRPCAVLVDGPDGPDVAQSACQVDSATSESDALRTLAKKGCRYAAVPPDGRTLPELVDFDGAPLVAIPEGRAQATAEGSALMRELLAGYERAERLGGVYSLRADRSWRAAAGRDQLFARVRDELDSRGAWFAAPEDLADWWRTRAHVRADLSVLAPDRVRVTFANSGKDSARGVTARVYLPGGADSARIESGPRLRASPLVRIAADHSWIEVVERSLDPGAEVSYTIRF